MSPPPPACARRSPTSPDTRSTPSRRQSASPTAASEKRLSSGGTSFARATVIVEARSGPNQGFARPPFTGLRVVITSNVGSNESDEASKRAPAASRPAHPPSASTLAEDASPPRSARRDTLVSCCSKPRKITWNLREHCPPSTPASFLNHNGGEKWAGGHHALSKNLKRDGDST